MNQPAQHTEVKVRRGRVSSVDLFEVKENELDLLERGSDADVYFNFAIALLSLSISITATFLSATFKSPKAEIIFIIITVLGYITGALLLVLWYRNKKKVKTVIETIRNRMPPEKITSEVDSITISSNPTVTTQTTTKPEG